MIATLSGVSYRYPGASVDALAGADLTVPHGAFVLVAGPSAGGKSTLLRLFNGLIPQFHGGRLRGEVRVAGIDPSRTPTREVARVAGMVFQEPEAQAVTELVEQEIAFGMEQQAVPREEMRLRLDEMMELLGIAHLGSRRLVTLSGGERQRVAIAAALALQPQLLLLDEPTSQLDPSGAESVIEALEGLHRGGTTVLLAEHRLERLLPVVDSVVSVSDGRVVHLGPREAATVMPGVPGVCAVARSLGWSPVPLSVAEALAAGHRLPAVRVGDPDGAPGAMLLATSGLTVEYDATVALRDASLELREGEIVALVGANGSGKSTLFRAIAGLVAPGRGEIRFAEGSAPVRVQERTRFAGLVPQDPAMALYRDSVRAELGESLAHRGRGKGIDTVLTEWALAGLSACDPRDLSVGQQQRVAVAAMLAHEPRVWLMDEPTRGSDLAAKAWLAERLRAHAAGGGAAIVATHDIESAAAYATRVIGLDAGEVVFDLPARRAFAADGPVPTQVARLVPGAISLEDLEL